MESKSEFNAEAILTYLKEDETVASAIQNITEGVSVKINNTYDSILIEELIPILNHYAIYSIKDLKTWMHEYITDINSYGKLKYQYYTEVNNLEYVVLETLVALILLDNDDFRTDFFEPETEDGDWFHSSFYKDKKCLKKLRTSNV